jgi:acetolactate synthase-1/2/3 large subunit
MGFGVAGVLGAKLAAPERPAVSVCGEGAFFMLAGGLGRAVGGRIRVGGGVWDKCGYGWSRGVPRGCLEGRELATDYFHPETGKPYNPDFAAMARSAGVEGVSIDRPGDLGDAILAGIASGKPYLIDANIGGDLNPPGAGVWELPGIGVNKPAIGERYVPKV